MQPIISFIMKSTLALCLFLSSFLISFAQEDLPTDYLSKDFHAGRRDAIRKIIDGELWLPPDVDLTNVPTTGDSTELVSRLATLTPQQVRVLMMLGEGLLNKQIAFKLGVSEATVKAHVSAILQKLGVDSRTQAVIAINRIGTAGDWPRAPN